jgi:hypothetical protein
MGELFELLTPQQTRKASHAPIEFAETAEDGWTSLVRRSLRAHGDDVDAAG